MPLFVAVVPIPKTPLYSPIVAIRITAVLVGKVIVIVDAADVPFAAVLQMEMLWLLTMLARNVYVLLALSVMLEGSVVPSS